MRVQFRLNAIDFLSLAASKSKDVIVGANCGRFADIEGFAVFLCYHHDFLGTQSQSALKRLICKSVLLKSLKESLLAYSLPVKRALIVPSFFAMPAIKSSITATPGDDSKELLAYVGFASPLSVSYRHSGPEINIIHSFLFRLADAGTLLSSEIIAVVSADVEIAGSYRI